MTAENVHKLHLKMNESETIRSIAIKLLEAKLKSDNIEDKLSHAIFVLGSKGCGKTAAINIFLEKDESQRETTGLEYAFGRKNVHGHLTEKNVCHVWELGGDLFHTADILNIPFQVHKRCCMTIILFLDLSQPKYLWSTLESSIENFKLAIEKNERKAKEKEGAQSATFFSMPLVIVGGKYDMYNELDATSKKLINKTLRGVCLLTGASLMYFSRADQNSKRRLKDFFGFTAFGTEQKSKTVILDINKPLFIPSGSDSWESIGVGPSTWDTLKNAYVSQFPQSRSAHVIPDDPSLEANYREPLIDLMRNQKDEELKVILNTSLRNHF